MADTFSKLMLQVHKDFEAILSSSPFSISSGLPPGIPSRGVYLFSQGKKHLYVGRSDNIRQRMGLHTRPSSGHNQATFAFRIAKTKLGIGAATYRASASRASLLSNIDFETEFAEAKLRIRSMSVRFVEENDPIVQAILEIFSAVELRTPYNEFKTT